MPTQIRWSPPLPLSPAEEAVDQKLRRTGKFYVFLREVRAELFDEAFQAQLAAAYRPRGTAPLPAALLAMVTLLQAYDQVSDAKAVDDGAGRSALAVGAGVPGVRAGAVFAGRAGQVPRADDRARPGSEAVGSDRRAGEADGAVRLAASARRVGFLAADRGGPRPGHVESAGPCAGDGGDLCRQGGGRAAGAGDPRGGPYGAGRPEPQSGAGHRLGRPRGAGGGA